MGNKRLYLLIAFYAPPVVGTLRVLLSVVYIIWNPLNLPLVIMQIFPMLVLLSSLFLYLKLFDDGDPIVLLVLSSVLHFLLILGFKRAIVIVPFIPLIVLDLVYLVIKGIKSVFFPFEIEGEEEDFGLIFEEEAVEDKE